MNNINPKREARTFAFQFLYHFTAPDLHGKFLEIKKDLQSHNTDSLELNILQFSESIHYPIDTNLQRFSKELIIGVIQQSESLDSIIEKNSPNWKITRISRVDLTILKIAIFELTLLKENPKNIIFNEAIELGKKYGSKDSSKFINGILEEISK